MLQLASSLGDFVDLAREQPLLTAMLTLGLLAMSYAVKFGQSQGASFAGLITGGLAAVSLSQIFMKEDLGLGMMFIMPAGLLTIATLTIYKGMLPPAIQNVLPGPARNRYGEDARAYASKAHDEGWVPTHIGLIVAGVLVLVIGSYGYYKMTAVSRR